MPLTKEAAKKKDSVLAEIQRLYPGAGTVKRTWDANKFSFAAPSDVWLNNFKALQRLEVDLKFETGGYTVRLKGNPGTGEIFTNVGTITASG